MLIWIILVPLICSLFCMLCVESHLAEADALSSTEALIRSVCSNIPGCKIDRVEVRDNFDELESLLDPSEGERFVLVQWQSSERHRVQNRLGALLAPRPWWHVTTTARAPASSPQQHAKHLLVLRLTPAPLNSILRQMAMRSFLPNAAQCANSPLLVSVHEDNTWGNRYFNIPTEYWDERYASCVFTVYIKLRAFDSKPVIYFAAPNECAHVDNKWECLFLPLSNCSVPRQLASCDHDEHDAAHRKPCMPNHWTFGLYSNASVDGAFVNEGNEREQFMKQHLSSLASSSPSSMPSFSSNFHQISIKSNDFIALHSNDIPRSISASTTINTTRSFNDMVNSIFMSGFASRMNLAFREKVDTIIHKFRHSFASPLSELTPCIAMHVRMDDRTPRSDSAVDIVTWCNRCARFTDSSNSTRADYDDSLPGCKHGYSDWMDMGCLSPLPFALATFEHFLNASIAIDPTIESIFVMTDDMKWIHSQLGPPHSPSASSGAERLPYLLRGRYKIYVYPVHPNHRQYSLQASEDFWASLTIAQQCRGFVGHFGSTATSMIFRSLCYYHNHRFLSCPPVFDISARMF